MNNKKASLAYTQKSPGLVDKLLTKIKINNKFDKSLNAEIVAQWDTGASMSAISKKLVEMMNLPTVSMTKIGTAGGVVPSTVHIIDLQLPNGNKIEALKVVSADLAGAQMLIGMDVIALGDFAISNYKGKTIFNFRIPSYADIDFVQMATNTHPISKNKKTNRNDPCPCGSGKKYKNCCEGKMQKI